MKRAISALFFASLFLLLTACPPGATLQFYPVSTGLREAASCRVAGRFDWALAAWVEADSVWTRRWLNGALEPAFNHGPGELPDVAITNRFTLAFVRDGAIVVREWRSGGWTDARVYAFALDVTLPRLTSWSRDEWEHGAYLCFQTDYGTVRFAENDQGDWQEAEQVFEGGPIWMPCFAQAVPVPDGQLWRPRVYAMLENDLVYCERGPGGFEAPVGVHPGEFMYGGEFAVASGRDNIQHALSNGPQPTCPCNVMHYTHGALAGAWSLPEVLSSEFDAYTWPQDPAIAVDAAGRVHAAWFQQHYNFLMEPSWRGLFYQVLDHGVWEDLSAGFCCQRGKDADLDLRYDYSPVLVWTQEWEGPSQVYLAVDPDVTGVQSPAAPPPALSAQPNPFNPRTTLRFALAAPATVDLAVYDAGGRRLRTLLAGRLPAGEQSLNWDGRDDAGRALPSGVYLARLAGSGPAESCKLVLLQ